jgi:hypothetical protein
MKFTEHRTPTGRLTVAEFTSVLQRDYLRLACDSNMTLLCSKTVRTISL